jgi:dienelactone hydrolase
MLVHIIMSLTDICFTTALIIISADRLLAQTLEEHKTVVAPLPDEDILYPCEYRLLLPESADPVKAVWVVFDRGQDYLRWYLDRQVQAFAREHRLALVLAMHCRSKEREDMIVEPAKGVGRALFTALDQFAASENRAELKTAPLIAMGWSGAGSLVGRLAGYRPERYLAGIAYAPGQYEPLGMDTIALSQNAIRMPQLIIANGADNINGTERPYAYFRKYFDKGAPWTFVIQNRTPHCCLQNVQTLILDWLRAILATPSKSWGAGKHGYITVEFSRVSDEWKRPVFNATSARVAETSREPASGELPAGWLPSSIFAEGWLAFVRRTDPIAVWKP